MSREVSHKRLVSLDAFRGFTIAAMILVNTPGSWDHVYAPLLHAEWHGVTPTDYIFPFFIFIVGISVTLSFGKLLARGKSKASLGWKTLKRAAIIFALGLFLWLFPDFNFSEIRFPGVLQRIALVFLACALLYLHTTWRQQALVGVVLLVLYWAMMELVPVPGVGAGVLEPGLNLAAWVDSVLVPGKMWQGTWDPEGILSTLPAVVTGILGMLAGRILAAVNLSEEKRVLWLFLGGFVLFAVGTVWGWVFPLNKNLWTSSYVLYTGGLAALTMASAYFVIEILGYAKWAAVGVVFGSNAISAYVLGSILPGLLAPANRWYVSMFIDGAAMPKLASMLWAIGVCILCYIPIYILYKKRLFIKI